MSFLVMFDYKKKHTYDARTSESRRITSKYPDRLPIICEVHHKSDLVLDKHKYLVPHDLTIGQFIYVLRRRIKLPPEKAIYLFTGRNQMPPTSMLLSKIYAESKDEDGFLYFMINSESTFG